MGSSVKEMFAVPKELYFHIIDKATEEQKHLLSDVNVDQVNVTCGPLFAGLKKGTLQEKNFQEQSQEIENRGKIQQEANAQMFAKNKPPIFAHVNELPVKRKDQSKEVTQNPELKQPRKERTNIPEMRESSNIVDAEKNKPMPKKDITSDSLSKRPKLNNFPTSDIQPHLPGKNIPQIAAPTLQQPTVSHNSSKTLEKLDDHIQPIDSISKITLPSPQKPEKSPNKTPKKITDGISSSYVIPKIVINKDLESPIENQFVPDMFKTLLKKQNHFDDILAASSEKDLVSAQNREFAALNLSSSKMPKSAEQDLNNQIFNKQLSELEKSGNSQEIEEVRLSAKKQGKPAKVKTMAENFYGTKNKPRSSLEARLFMQNRDAKTRGEKASIAKVRRDEIRKTGIKITSPEKKQKKVK